MERDKKIPSGRLGRPAKIKITNASRKSLTEPFMQPGDLNILREFPF